MLHKVHSTKFWFTLIISLLIISAIFFYLKGIFFSSKELNISKIVKTINPAVVTIMSNSGQGSGFIISPSGDVLTNAHVLDSMQATIKFYNGATTIGHLVKIDEDKDIALLKIFSNTEYPYLKMGDSSKCLSGDTVIAVGSPLSLNATVTRGIISAIRNIPGFNITVIQTDAAVNAGNSGGPLINTSGEVVGINTLSVKKYIAEGLNFALSINDIKQFVNQQQPGDTQQAQQVIERKTTQVVQEFITIQKIREHEQEERRRMINEEVGKRWQQEAWQKEQADRAERLKRLRASCEDQAIRQIGFDPRTYNAAGEAARDRNDFAHDLYRRWPSNLTREQIQLAEYYINNHYQQRLRYHNERKNDGIRMFNYSMKNCYKETP